MYYRLIFRHQSIVFQKLQEEFLLVDFNMLIRLCLNEALRILDAADRQEFERLFGRGANYCAEDITRITYGKKTLYEAPPIQAEDMAERIEMGGMQLG